VHATGHPLLEQLDFERIIQRFVNQSEVDSTMCGRYARRGDKQKIAETFHVKDVPDFAMPDADYNIAPTTFQPIIRESRDTSEREMVLARWDLIPFFTKELSDIKGLSTINAKAETIATARTWREPFKKRRCLPGRRPIRSRRL
jgi:putative SOS response-associated peptidase YedK